MDEYYLYVLQQCQSEDSERRLAALDELEHDYLDLIEPQFLLDRLNSISHWQEQRAIVGLMCQIKKPLPVQALMAMLEDRETTSMYLRMQVASTLAFVKAEESLDLVLRLIQDADEEICLRELLVESLSAWGERIPLTTLLTLFADPESAICAAALRALEAWTPQAIPIETVLPYCTHAEWYVREAAIKTLLAAEAWTPIDPILAALSDPDDHVRDAAAHGCIQLVERFGDQVPLEPLLQVLHDDFPSVRENVIDALGKAPTRAPLEPIIAALADPLYYVRCAAAESLSMMGTRVPVDLYPTLQAMSGTDPVAQVRIRATRALLILHGVEQGPPKIPTIDLALDDFEE